MVAGPAHTSFVLRMVITEDRKPSAHFEHTVLVTAGDPEILTWRPREALPEMLGLPAW